jgi:hypothetical protein
MIEKLDSYESGVIDLTTLADDLRGLVAPSELHHEDVVDFSDHFPEIDIVLELRTEPWPRRLGRLAGGFDAFHARLNSGAQVVMLDNGYVQTRSTPISRRDVDGNTYQRRTLDDGRARGAEELPTREQALELLGPRAVEPTSVEYDNYWTLAYRIA